VKHVIANKTEQKITLIGYSHRGNVAIQAARMLWDQYQISVDIVNFNTPAYNDFNDPENPEQNFGIDNFAHFYTKGDAVAGPLAPGSDDSYARVMGNHQLTETGEWTILFGWLTNHFMANVNTKEVKKQKPDADEEACKRSGGCK
jgi:hypothetical protein